MADEKKEIILNAAIDVFARQGFYKTNTSSIAEEGAVAVGTIYNYFDSKEAILEEIFARELRWRLQMLEEVGEREDLDIIEKLEKFLERHFERVRENPNLGQVLVREREFPRKKSEAMAGYFYGLPEKFADIIDEAREEGEVEVGNSEVAASIIFGAFQGITENALRDCDLDLLAAGKKEIVNILTAGIV